MMNVDIANLVQNDGSLVSRRVFSDRDIYELEQACVFGNAWWFLGHECEIPNPGDFMTNVEVISGDQVDEWRVHANFLVYRSRLETEQDYFVGTREDLLRRVEGQLQIARRKIIYDATVSSAKNLSIFF